MRFYRRNRLTFILIYAGMTLICGCASTTLVERAKTDIKSWPKTLVDNGRETFLATNNIAALSLAGGMSVAMHQDVDIEMARHLEEHQQLRNLKDEGLNFIGHPTTHFVATGLWYALSAENQDEFNNRRAWTMINALSLTWVTVGGLKVIRNNETPNGDDLAWPSGHTASSFTVASVPDEFYGPKVGIPAYAAASLVAYRMMDTGNHWASDVVFGATLGWIVGHTVAGKHKGLEVGGFTVVPQVVYNDGPGLGISLLKQF